ncbi:MAG: hypothetical protein JNM80_07355 [Phycisphaerae bacterium]|nr:hypothetical protein [Phycisphaerae bacterium]
MKRIVFSAACVGAIGCVVLAQQPGKQKLPAGHPGAAEPRAAWPAPKPADVSTIDGLVAAMYAAPAGAPGEPRDWDRYRSLFLPDARLVASRPGEGDAAVAMFLTIGDYIDANKTYFEKGGFMDKEIARRTEQYGNIAHVWSTYESRHKPDDPEPYVRGINSIQVLKDSGRWWIVNVFWDYERAETPIPEQYLKSPAK